MAITRWDPFRDLLSLKDRMDRLFEDTITRSRSLEENSPSGAWAPAVDIYEADDAIVAKAELPGVDKKDISIEVKENTLTLKGERKFAKEVKEENYHRIERSYGAFQRSFTLPSNVDKSKTKANYKDGILEIKLYKVEEARPKQIKVNVE